MYAKYPDTILLNGIVVSMEDDIHGASAVAVVNDRIIYVGTDEKAMELGGPETEIIDLKGKVLLPGLIESHMHPMLLAKNLLGVQCGGEATKSIENIGL